MSCTSLRSRAAQEWPRVVVGLASADRVLAPYFLMNQPVPPPRWLSENFATVFHIIMFIMTAPMCLSGLYAAIMKSLRAAKINMYSMVLPGIYVVATGTTGLPAAIGGTIEPSDFKMWYLWLFYYALVNGYAWSSLVLIRDCRGQPRSAFGFLKRYEKLEVSDPGVSKRENSEPEVEKLEK
ncbi:hypothetical protein BGZ82_003445 [Podila clonocystis]|nr:hypothetical protein BGZ82_003445 [Podila clonocystis]